MDWYQLEYWLTRILTGTGWHMDWNIDWNID